MSDIKSQRPAPWALEPGYTERPYLWRDLNLLIPWWGVGQPRDTLELITNSNPGTVHGSPTSTVGRGGLGVEFVKGSTEGLRYSSTAVRNATLTNDYSYAIVFESPDSPGSAAVEAIYAISDDNTGASSSENRQGFNWSHPTAAFRCSPQHRNVTSGFQNTGDGSSFFSANTVYSIVVTYCDSNQDFKLFRNGRQVTSNLSAPNGSPTAAGDLMLGAGLPHKNLAIQSPWSGKIYFFAEWGVCLSDGQAELLSQDPYTLIRRNKTIFIPRGFVTGAQSVNLGLAQETDTALAITATPGAASVTLGLAQETDTAFTITPTLGTQTVNLGLAQETDTALSITPTPGAASVTLGLAQETDTAFSITPSSVVSVTLGLAQETDTAFSITPTPGPVSVTLGLAQETDTAFPITIAVPAPDIYRTIDVTDEKRLLNVTDDFRIISN